MKKGIIYLLIFMVLLPVQLFSQEQRDLVNGNLILFNDNGAWCWYQDERAVVDKENNMLITGSVASAAGPGGNPRNGDIDAVIMDLNTMQRTRYLLKNGGGNAFYCDDHNAPAFLVRPDGKYLAMYAAHFNDTTSYYRIFHDNEWGQEQGFNWARERPGGSNFQTTYSNVYYLSAEERAYNFVRGNNKSPNSMISMDFGDSWSYGGQLAYGSNIGYNNGYYRYNGNGIDRIDFVCTEYHPRDYNTSIYHGYIQNGKSYQSDGTLIDDNIFDIDYIPNASDFTQVFEAGTVINDMTMYRCWNIDIQRYADGTVATVISARINNNEGGGSGSINPDHAFIYCRYNGSEWSYTYLGKAGQKLYSSEQDYTGLAAMHPATPDIIYISTTVDPRNNSDLGVHEIFRGVTFDQGITWDWSPVTWNSVRDNMRPIIPSWDENHLALLWWRGTYNTAQIYDAAVVGIVENSDESVALLTYVDADTQNTRLVNGNSMILTGPSRDDGPADNNWHWRYGYGYGKRVFASGESGGEDAPMLVTTVTIPDTGTFDIWVNFWGDPAFDWRIKAGLSQDQLQLYRSMACQQVEPGNHTLNIPVKGDEYTYLYQAYLGRVHNQTDQSIQIYVDDETIRNGSSYSMVGDIARTWYDGISYAKVGNSSQVRIAENESRPLDYGLSQNYPNPFNPVTQIDFTIAKYDNVILTVYDLLGRKVAELLNQYMPAGSHSVTYDAHNLASGIYYYQLSTASFTQTRKMIILK